MSKVIKGKELEKKEGSEGKVAPIRRHVDLSGAVGGGVVARRVLSAQQKAEKILSFAEADAARIRQEAHEVLEAVEEEREKARKAGYAEGEAKGLATVSEQLMKLHALKEKFFAETEEKVIKLVMAVAEKIIGQLATEHPEVVRHVVCEALAHAIGDRITVRVNPEDYKTILKDDQEFRALFDRTKTLLFKEDETIQKGGCVVETEIGTIDARVEQQLAAIKKALHG